MDLTFSEDQRLLQESARRFLAGEYMSGKKADSWRQFAELGWLALPFAEDDGGLAGTATETMLLLQEFGAALVTEPYIPTILMAGALVAKCGDAAQRAAILPAVMSGEHLLAFAYAEPGFDNDPAKISASATQAGDGWRLEGRKIAVLGGGLANTYVVSAMSDGNLALFLVPADAHGVDILPYRSVDGRAFADITLSGVSMPASALLNGGPETLPLIEAVLDQAAIALCADAYGAMGVLVDATVEYAKTRTQFGKAIGSFQALSHRMADMAVMREEARALLLLGALKADAPAPERRRATAALKAKLGACARFIGQQAVQIHGGMGVTEELSIGAYFKRLTTFEILFGNTDHHLQRYATLAVHSNILSDGLLSAKSKILMEA